MKISVVSKLLLLCSALVNGTLVEPESTLVHTTEKDNVYTPANSRLDPNSIFPFLSPGYKKFEIPRFNTSVPMFVNVVLVINDVDVDTKNEVLELDTLLELRWNDWNIWRNLVNQSKGWNAEECTNALFEEGECTPYVILDIKSLKYIWTPDIIIDEMKTAYKPSLLFNTTNLILTTRPEAEYKEEPGTILYATRTIMKLRCGMDFHFYPADIQKCNFTFRTFANLQLHIRFLWDLAWLESTSNANFQFQLSNVEPRHQLKDLYYINLGGVAFPALSFTLQIRRKITFHLAQTFLPSVLLVLITLLCFLIPASMIEARIGVCMTTLLTMTAMFTTVREQAPEVSYVTAIDIWMVFSMFLIFLALVMFTTTHWMRRKLEAHENKQRTPSSNEHTEEYVPTEAERQAFQNIVRLITRYALIAFVTSFLLFLFVYAFWILVLSGYYEWDPSPDYNALEDNQTVFKRVETPFEEKISEGRKSVSRNLSDHWKETLWNENKKYYSREL